MSHNVGADELRVRARLRELVDGPTAEPPPMPPGPPPDGYQPKTRDWLDDILDSNAKPAAPHPARGPVPLPGPVTKEPANPKASTRKKPPRRRPAYRTDQRSSSPRLSLLDAWDRTPHRLKWLAYHAAAAAAGWRLGWVGWATDTAAWYADGHWISPSAWVLYAFGACACALYRRSRAWAWPVAWAAAIPVSSVVLGVALYGTGYPS